MWAQLPPTTGADLGNWLIPAAAVMAIVYLARQTFFPARVPTAEYVTKGEFDAFKKDLLERMGELDRYTRQQFEALKTDVVSRVEKLDHYQHDSAHRLGGAVQTLLLKVERLVTIEETRSVSSARAPLWRQERPGPPAAEEGPEP